MKTYFAWMLAAVAGGSTLGCKPPAEAESPAPTPAPPPAPEPAPVFSLAAEVHEGQDEQPGVSSRITEVTVYSDRALVTREAGVTVGTEPSAHSFRQLPGWIDEGSIRASTSAGKILDVSVERDFLARSTDEGFQRAEKKHRQLQRKMQALEDELAILASQREHVDSIEVFSVEKLSEDAVTRDVDVSSYGEVVRFVSDQLRATAEARRAIEKKREELAPELEASARKLEELRQLTNLEQTTVTVKVEAETENETTLALTYATPGATWEPAHELRASSEHPESVALTSHAVVTQTTGEDWSHAELSFSTQSSSDAQQIPELEKLALGEPVETKRSIERTSTFKKARKKYEEQNRHWNRLNQVPSRKQAELSHFEESYSSNLEYFEQVQSKTVQMFQGLERRGTTAHFVALEPGVVRSDGIPVRVPIGGETITAREKIIAAPEQSLNAAVTLEMENVSGQPLLPGRVARYYDGAFLGVTDTDFVAPGEDFSVYFRVADRVKLSRELDRKKSSLSRRTRNRMNLSFVSAAENLSDRPVSLVLAERVPVSENSEVRVSRVRISPDQDVDSQGIARWKITLKPGERRTFRISYRIDYPPSLILDFKRKRRAPRSPTDFSGGDVERRIYQYEKMF